MSMYESGARRLRCQLISKMAVWRDFETFLFRCSVHGYRNDLSMPVDQLGCIGITEQVHRNRNALTESD